jgi:hypothetical protein
VQYITPSQRQIPRTPSPPKLKTDQLSGNLVTINSMKFSDTVTKPDTSVTILETIDKRNSNKTATSPDESNRFVALRHGITELDDTALHSYISTLPHNAEINPLKLLINILSRVLSRQRDKNIRGFSGFN